MQARRSETFFRPRASRTRSSDEFEYTGKFGVVPFGDVLYKEDGQPTDAARKEVSDHLPLWAEFRVTELENELDQIINEMQRGGDPLRSALNSVRAIQCASVDNLIPWLCEQEQRSGQTLAQFSGSCIVLAFENTQRMRDLTNNNFGHLIAYLIPGLTALWGASHLSPTFQSWLTTHPSDLPTVGGFLYLTLGSVTAGMIVSTVRWLIVDAVHHATGLTEPRWDFSQLASKVAGFESLIRIHYQFYQFNANMLIAIVFTYALRKATDSVESVSIGWEDVTWLLLAVVFFAGSRDTLRKYYLRVEGLLGRDAQLRR